MIAGVPSNRQRLVFPLLVLAHIFYFQLYRNFLATNEFSRFHLVSAIVDYGTFAIDEPLRKYGDSQDKASIHGHYYSDKAIGVSLLAVPVYFPLKKIADSIGAQLPPQIWIFLLRIFCVTIPSLLFLSALSKFWLKLRPDSPFISHCLFLYLFGTIVFTYSLQFISHSLLAISLFLSFYFFSSDGSKARLIWCGAFAGFALLLEYPAVVPVTFLFLYFFWSLKNKSRIAWPIVASAPFVVIMLGYNYAITGSPFDVTYRHMVDPKHIGEHAAGFIGLQLPRIKVLWALMMSPERGMFFISPILLLSFPGFYLLIREKKWRKEGILFSAICLGLLTFYSGMSNWDGAWSLGPRYLTPSIPFLMTGVFFFVSECKTKPWIAPCMIFLGTVSVLLVTIGTLTFPFPAIEIKNPLFTIHVPLLLKGGCSLNAGMLLGFNCLGSSMLFYTLLLVIFLLMILPGSDFKIPSGKAVLRPVLPFTLAVFLIALATLLFRSTRAFDYYARASIFFYLGQYAACENDLMTAIENGPDEELKQLILRRLILTREYGLPSRK